jgi:hypothetical protein
MSEGQVKWTLRKMLWITLAFSCAIMFIADPYGWLPEPDMSPCTAESTRATCTGKITFFWQTP